MEQQLVDSATSKKSERWAKPMGKRTVDAQACKCCNRCAGKQDGEDRVGGMHNEVAYELSSKSARKMHK